MMLMAAQQVRNGLGELVAADMAEMVALVDIKRTPTEELREIIKTCEGFPAALAELEARAEAPLP